MDGRGARGRLIAGRWCAAVGWLLWIVMQVLADDPFPPEISVSQYGLGEFGWVFTVCALTLAAAGLFVDATAADYRVAPGDEVAVTATVINRSTAPITLKQVSFPTANGRVDAKPAAGGVGVPVELKRYEGIGHALLVGVFARPLRGLAPALDDVIAFVGATPARR